MNERMCSHCVGKTGEGDKVLSELVCRLLETETGRFLVLVDQPLGAASNTTKGETNAEEIP